MRGHVRKRVTCEFIVDIGRHPVTGCRRQKSKSGFATRTDAERALREFIRFMEGGGDPFPERIFLSDQLSHWLEYERARGIRPRTLYAYQGYIRRDILPVIGDLEVEKIRPSHVRAVLTRMQLRGLAGSTVTQVRGILSSALRQAMEDGRIATNPVASVKRPKTPKAEVHWPDPAQVAALLEASRGSIWEAPVLIAATPMSSREHLLPGRPGDGGLVGPEATEDLVGKPTTEETQGLGLGAAPGQAMLDVGSTRSHSTPLGERDAMQRRVDLAVPSAVQAMTSVVP